MDYLVANMVSYFIDFDQALKQVIHQRFNGINYFLAIEIIDGAISFIPNNSHVLKIKIKFTTSK